MDRDLVRELAALVERALRGDFDDHSSTELMGRLTTEHPNYVKEAAHALQHYLADLDFEDDIEYRSLKIEELEKYLQELYRNAG